MAKGRPTSGGFKPGVSGNPGGRPKIVSTLKEMCREKTPEIFAELLVALKNPVTTVTAAALLLAYGYGRPVVNAHVRVIRGLADLTEEELIAIAEDAESQRDGERLH